MSNPEMKKAIGEVLREWYAEESDEKYDQLVAKVILEAIAPHFGCPRQHTWPSGHPQDITPWSDWDPNDLVDAMEAWSGRKG